MPIARRLIAAIALLAWIAAAAPAAANPTLLVDLQTGEVLHEEAAGHPWHPASLTKLMTAYLAFTAISNGRIGLDTPIKISQRAWNQAPSKSGLEVGSAITLRDALYILIVKSANDVAVAIAEAVSGSEAAADFFVRRGFREVDRSEVPDPKWVGYDPERLTAARVFWRDTIEEPVF